MKLRTWNLGLIAMLASWQASAAFITLNASDYANGTDVSHALHGATLSVSWGYQGDFAYSSSAMSVHNGSFASADAATPYGNEFAAIWAELPMLLGGAMRDDISIFRVDFDTPTDYVELFGAQRSVSMLLQAFDIDGQMIGQCATHDTPDISTYDIGRYDDCWNHFGPADPESTMRAEVSTSIARSTADIAYIRGASSYAGGSVTIDRITYNGQSVPEPATLGLLGLGMIGLVMARRRRAMSVASL